MTTYVTGLKSAVQLAGAWTDISAYVYDTTAPQSVTTTGGRGDETAQVTPTVISGEMNNRDFRFTARNPAGPYYPAFGRNTPLRLSVPYGSTYLRMEDDAASYISCPDSASLQLTGSLSLLMDVQLSNYMPCVLASKWGVTGTAWAWSLNGDGTLTFTWYDGSTVHQASSTAPIPLGRVSLQVFLTAGSGTVTFKTGAANYSGMTQLGAVVGPGGTTSVSAAAGQVVAVGDSATFDAAYGTQGLQGAVFTFFLQNASFTTVASGTFSSQADGTTTYTDAESNTWTVSGSALISGQAYIAHAQMSELPVSWDPSGRDVWLPFQAGGVLRRLAQGNSPVQSAMRRAVTQLAGTVAYWPCEDLAGATQIASGLPGGQPMAISGTPGLATSTVFASSAAVPELNGSTWFGSAPAYTAGTSAAVRFITEFPNAGTENNLVSFATTGTVAVASVMINSGNIFFTDQATGLFITTDISGLSGQPVLVSAELSVSGGTVTAALRVVTLTGAVTSQTATFSGSIGNIRAVVVNSGADTGGAGPLASATPLGHVWAENNPVPVADLAAPFAAWAGETAGNRVTRLCAENNVSPRVYGYPDESVAMGGQPVDTLPNLLQACEDADRGLLYEPATCLGIGYRTVRSMTGQSPAVTLDYSKGQVGDQENSPVSLASVDDDLYTVNDWLISRENGSSVEVMLSDGSAMSTGTIGAYQNSKDIYLNTDSQLPDLAGWMLHVSTANDERYPTVVTGLHNPAIIAASLGPVILGVRIGDLIEISNPPAWLPPGPINLIVTGVNHKLTGWLHQVSWNCVPASPYLSALFYDTGMHFNTDGSTLHATITSGATSMSVTTTGPQPPSPLWTTSAGDFPFNVIMDGEVITVTNITGSSSPQTFTITRSVNGVVKAHTAGAAVGLYPPPVWALT